MFRLRFSHTLARLEGEPQSKNPSSSDLSKAVTRLYPDLTPVADFALKRLPFDEYRPLFHRWKIRNSFKEALDLAGPQVC